MGVVLALGVGGTETPTRGLDQSGMTFAKDSEGDLVLARPPRGEQAGVVVVQGEGRNLSYGVSVGQDSAPVLLIMGQERNPVLRCGTVMSQPSFATRWNVATPEKDRGGRTDGSPAPVLLIRPTPPFYCTRVGEEMTPVTVVLPLAESDSALLRTPENLRACRRCDQLIGLDVSDCPYCGLRQKPL